MSDIEENVRWEPVVSHPSGRTGKVKLYTKNGKNYAGNILWDDGGDLYSEMERDALTRATALVSAAQAVQE